MQTDKAFNHGTGKILVHGEVLAVPIHGGAKPLHLGQDCATVFAPPFPDAFQERFAAKLLAALAFGSKLALDHHLRGNSRVVRSRKPECEEATHAPPADNDVHLRLVQHVTNVQASGDVRWWQ